MASWVRTRWIELGRWFYGWVGWVFFSLFTVGALFLLASLTCWQGFLSTTDKVALFAGLLTGAIIWWQGKLLNRQLAYGTVLDLYKEWSSETMLGTRRNAWNLEKEVPNPGSIEDVLEFLEKVSTLERDKYITRNLIWDTFGWYIGRYYFYCKNVIEDLRVKWTPKYDPTLYQDLEAFYPILLKLDVDARNGKRKSGSGMISTADIEEEYRQTRKMFITSEVEENH